MPNIKKYLTFVLFVGFTTILFGCWNWGDNKDRLVLSGYITPIDKEQTFLISPKLDIIPWIEINLNLYVNNDNSFILRWNVFGLNYLNIIDKLVFYCEDKEQYIINWNINTTHLWWSFFEKRFYQRFDDVCYDSKGWYGYWYHKWYTIKVFNKSGNIIHIQKFTIPDLFSKNNNIKYINLNDLCTFSDWIYKYPNNDHVFLKNNSWNFISTYLTSLIKSWNNVSVSLKYLSDNVDYKNTFKTDIISYQCSYKWKPIFKHMNTIYTDFLSYTKNIYLFHIDKYENIYFNYPNNRYIKSKYINDIWIPYNIQFNLFSWFKQIIYNNLNKRDYFWLKEDDIYCHILEIKKNISNISCQTSAYIRSNMWQITWSQNQYYVNLETETVLELDHKEYE